MEERQATNLMDFTVNSGGSSGVAMALADNLGPVLISLMEYETPLGVDPGNGLIMTNSAAC